MGQTDEGFVDKLTRIVLDSKTLDHNKPETIARLGAALEQLAADVLDTKPNLANTFTLCLEALKAIYLGTVDEPQSLVDLVINTIGSIQAQEDYASEAACRLISESLNTVPPEQSDTSLDDVAALLVQLDPTDTPSVNRISSLLREVASSSSTTVSMPEKVIEAADMMDSIAREECTDAASVIAQVGDLIEQAMDAAEDEPQIESESDTTEQIVWNESLPPDADSDLIGDFITECREYIEGAEAALLSIESDPNDSEAVNTVFRAFHTIKGTSAFLGLNGISELAHKAESLLSRVRDKEIQCTGGYADLALRSVDALKDLIQGVQDALGGDPICEPPGYGELINLLTNPEASGISEDFNETSEASPRLGDILVAEGMVDREDVEAAAVDQGDAPIGQALLKSDAASLVDVAKALRTQKRLTGKEQSVESSVRVRTDRLDSLIETVGELVIAHSMVVQDEMVVLGGRHELSKKVIHMGKIVRDLQYLSMSMRMVPLKPTFQKMARLVRDVAHKSDKQVQFVTEGDETEIDRNMVDVINDPLVHMVRNAVDHGIESREARISAGKPPVGTVKLKAYHAGGNVIVEMQDDGKGLDRQKIVEKAIAKGLIESDKGMSDSNVFNLIFEPGFSTADKVTDISGRGVGLDVVKKHIEGLRGRMEITSVAGEGCTFAMRLPLTMAVTDGMLVRVGDERFIIPTIAIFKSFRPNAEELSTVNGRGELVMLRDELMPVFRLHKLFKIAGAVTDPTKGLLVVLEEGGRHYALLVDELLGQYHVVAKALSDGVGKLQGVSGGAILGDGRVGLILDAGEIASLVRQSAVGTAGKESLCMAA